MTLPTIVIAARSAIKSVPPSIEEAAIGLGSSKVQTIFNFTLPLAMPGILTGTIIGIAQAIAILPGISRSGATISTSVLLGIDKEKAAKFSFLMVVPLIIGKILYDLIFNTELLISENLFALLMGFLSSFLTGLLACKLMIYLVKKSKLKYFSLYCIIVALFCIFI